MKALFAVLPFIALAACETQVTSTIRQTNETVVYAGKSYDVYVERFHDPSAALYGTTVHERRMMWVDSRYLWCEPSCTAAIAAWRGYETAPDMTHPAL